jgi:hypothetical protein
MRVAQRSFPAPNVSLTAISDSSSGKTDCSIGIVTGSTGDGLAGTPVAKKEPCKRGYCPMANLRVRVRCEDLDEVRHNVGNAKALCAAPLTRRAMQRGLAHRCHGIAKSEAKYVPRGIACVVVQKKQAGSPDTQIRVAKCGDLHGRNGHLAAATCSPLLRKRIPSTNEIVGDFKVRSCHGDVNSPRYA